MRPLPPAIKIYHVHTPRLFRLIYLAIDYLQFYYLQFILLAFASPPAPHQRRGLIYHVTEKFLFFFVEADVFFGIVFIIAKFFH
jgi:hypothetical protein